MSSHFSLRSLYLYLVCLITLLVSLFALVSLVRTTAGLIYPAPFIYAGDGVSKHDLLMSTRHDSILSLVGSVTTLLITVPLYLYHWSKVQSEKAPEITK